MQLLAVHRIAQVLRAARQQQLTGLGPIDLNLLHGGVTEHGGNLRICGTGVRQLNAAQMTQAVRRIKPRLAVGVGGLKINVARGRDHLVGDRRMCPGLAFVLRRHHDIFAVAFPGVEFGAQHFRQRHPNPGPGLDLYHEHRIRRVMRRPIGASARAEWFPTKQFGNAGETVFLAPRKTAETADE